MLVMVGHQRWSFPFSPSLQSAAACFHHMPGCFNIDVHTVVVVLLYRGYKRVGSERPSISQQNGTLLIL